MKRIILFDLLMTVALLWSGVRTAVLSPISSGVLALGAPMRTAVSGRELKSRIDMTNLRIQDLMKSGM